MTQDELRQEKFTLMTTAPIKGLICKMAIPTIISMLITAFYNLVDTFFMGQINPQATAAVGIVFSLMAIIQAIGFFFGHGSGNYISRKLGAQEKEEASKMAATGFFCAFLCGVVILLLGIVFLSPLAALLGSTPTIQPYTEKYMFIILLSTPFMTASLVLNNQLRLQGNAIYAMVGIGAGAVLNVALDPLFIFVFDMGISGAALATAISQVVSFFLLFYCNRISASLTIRLKNFSPTKEKLLAILQGGMPSLCRQGLASVATILLNHALGIYGDAAVAAMSIVSRVGNFAGSALIGFGQGFQPVCGFNYGAKLYPRVKAAFWFCVKVSTVVFTALGVAGVLFAPQIVAVFCGGDFEVTRIGAETLRLQCYAFPFLGFIILSNMMLQNINKYISASILSMGRQGLFFIPLVLVLPNLFGLFGAELCQPIADILTFAISIPMAISVLREMTRQSKA